MLMEDFVTFQAGTYDFQRQCFSGQIIDDSVAETTEQFEFNFLPENSFDYTDPGSFRFQVMDRDGEINHWRTLYRHEGFLVLFTGNFIFLK